jgi:hypothetical protein
MAAHSEVLLTGAALLIICIVGWVRSAGRARVLKSANEELKRDLAEVAKALENEMKWRFATEAFNEQIAAANDIAAKSTRELQQLLAAENFTPASVRDDETPQTSPRQTATSDEG